MTRMAAVQSGRASAIGHLLQGTRNKASSAHDDVGDSRRDSAEWTVWLAGHTAHGIWPAVMRWSCVVEAVLLGYSRTKEREARTEGRTWATTSSARWRAQS